jgi:UDP-N-acetylglucosamine pyrophosphorylase
MGSPTQPPPPLGLRSQARSGTGRKLHFAIMTSDDTHGRTVALLEAHAYFGLDKEQVPVREDR